MRFVSYRGLGYSSLFALPLLVTSLLIAPASAQTGDMTTLEDTSIDSTTPEALDGMQQEDLSDPQNLRPLNQASSLLSMQGGQRLMAEAGTAIETQSYDEAAKKLQEARQVFNQLSNFHLQLANSFQGIDNKIFESQRKRALETGQMRDEATYQLALVHRAQNQPELSVPLLIQVIRSQDPNSNLGKKSYQQLFELGFVDTPYSR
jgi:thioredoxin-like negative regulator of GroEL